MRSLSILHIVTRPRSLDFFLSRAVVALVVLKYLVMLGLCSIFEFVG
jgi:hypothetical protein